MSFWKRPKPTRPSGPAQDPIGMVRVHPQDDPQDPMARRVIHVDCAPHKVWLSLVADPQAEHPWVADDAVSSWNTQSLAEVARIFGHPGS